MVILTCHLEAFLQNKRKKILCIIYLDDVAKNAPVSNGNSMLNAEVWLSLSTNNQGGIQICKKQKKTDAALLPLQTSTRYNKIYNNEGNGCILLAFTYFPLVKIDYTE